MAFLNELNTVRHNAIARYAKEFEYDLISMLNTHVHAKSVTARRALLSQASIATRRFYHELELPIGDLARRHRVFLLWNYHDPEASVHQDECIKDYFENSPLVHQTADALKEYFSGLKVFVDVRYNCLNPDDRNYVKFCVSS